jgi:hypothetical protein
MTFRELDGDIVLSAPNSPLEQWYSAVRDMDVADLEIGDIARSLHQDLFLETIVPVALRRLEADPLAGELYGGELLVAMKGIGRGFWLSHPEEANRLVTIAKQAMELSLDSDLNLTARDLIGM